MKMITGINSCDECPYVNKEIVEELNGYDLATCFHPNNHCPTIDDSGIVDENCPLEDMPEQTEITDEQFAKELQRRYIASSTLLHPSLFKTDCNTGFEEGVGWLKAELLKPHGGERE